MSCWMENPADKDKFPAPSHFLFSCFGWGSLQGSAGAELWSWHFLGSMSLQREGKKKSGSSVPRLCNLVTSHWHFCQGWQGGEGRMEGPREGTAGPVYPLQELSQVLWSLCPCWGVSMNCEKPWERPHSWGEWKGRSAPHRLHHLVPRMSQEDEVTLLWAQRGTGIASTLEDLCPGFLGGFGGAGWWGSQQTLLLQISFQQNLPALNSECNWVKQAWNLRFTFSYSSAQIEILLWGNSSWRKTVLWSMCRLV